MDARKWPRDKGSNACTHYARNKSQLHVLCVYIYSGEEQENGSNGPKEHELPLVRILLPE